MNALRFGAAAEPQVAIVVLNWNGWLDTVECLESLLRSDYANYRIIVCDNSSVDGSFERLQEWASGRLTVNTTADGPGGTWAYRPALKPLRSVVYDPECDAHAPADCTDAPLIFVQTGANLGYAGGNNVGIRYALAHTDARYVWILNNDTIVDPHALTRMVDCASRDRRIAIVGATLLRHAQPDIVQAYGGGSIIPMVGVDTQFGRGTKVVASPALSKPLEHVVGASMFVRTEAIRSAGLLEESYFLYREETDWCIKLRRLGWKLVFCPEAVVWHKEGRSVGFKSELHDYYSVRNMLYLMQQYYPRTVPLAVVYWLFRSLLPKLVRLQFRRIGCVARAFRDFFRGVNGKSDAFAHSWPLLEAALRAEEEAVRARTKRQKRAHWTARLARSPAKNAPRSRVLP
ncbi:MAG TPA: glycosyltransferase family 2 protein [Candidatus Dormibacteraeota bacterium]|nr:glycosyltransferase family 2 protein [Candidatus Dormibacteraeota bacterium]